MTHARPSDPDPGQSPDVDRAGSPASGQPPASDSTSMGSDSATTQQDPAQDQSPTPQPTKKGAYIWIAVIVLFIILMAVGVMGYAFELF